MKAWRFYGFNDMRLDDVPEPVASPGHILVEPLCVQPSVTEAQLAYGIPTLAFDRIQRRFETEAPVQLFGHEFCARIIEIKGPSRFHPGDRVAARAKLPCGECSLCKSERSELCRKGPVIGFDLPGCFRYLRCDLAWKPNPRAAHYSGYAGILRRVCAGSFSGAPSNMDGTTVNASGFPLDHLIRTRACLHHHLLCMEVGGASRNALVCSGLCHSGCGVV